MNNMRGEKPESSSNITPNQPSPDNRDWRDQRREWREERRRGRFHDPLRGLFWGLLLVMLGVIFFANQQGWIANDKWWEYLLIGLGAIFIIDGLAHYWNTFYRHHNFGRFIPGLILLFVGLAFVFNFSEWWPIILIAVGVVLLLSLFFPRR
jgi:hypothetical protein